MHSTACLLVELCIRSVSVYSASLYFASGHASIVLMDIAVWFFRLLTVFNFIEMFPRHGTRWNYFLAC